jgi:hypothetical protein
VAGGERGLSNSEVREVVRGARAGAKDDAADMGGVEKEVQAII